MTCPINTKPPTAIDFDSYLIVPTPTNTGNINYNPPLNLEKEDTFEIDKIYNQNWALPTDPIFADSNWNSWKDDPLPKLNNLSYAAKSVAVMGNYYVEWFYGSQPQNVVDNFATNPPIDMYQAAKTEGLSLNNQVVVGTKLASDIPDTVFYFLFKGYLCRFVYFIESAVVANAPKILNLVMVPVKDESFYKILQAKPYNAYDQNQPLTSNNTFLAQFSKSSGYEKVISSDTWDAQPYQSSSLVFHVHSGDTQTQATMTPSVKYGTFPLQSLDFKVSGSVITTKYENYNLVYRMTLRYWVTGNPTTPTLADGNLYTISQPTDNCSARKVVPISGTQSSTPGIHGIQFKTQSLLMNELQKTSRDNKVIPDNILQNLPNNINIYADLQPTLVGTSQQALISYVVNDNNEIKGKTINELLDSQGTTRISYDEGTTWSSWQAVSDRFAYINANEYVGTAPQPRFPGNLTNMISVSNKSAICNGCKTNTWIEISIPIII